MDTDPRTVPFVPTPLSCERDALRQAIVDKLAYELGKDPANASLRDAYRATCLALRERLVNRWHDTQAKIRANQPKKVYYLSLEFLMGRAMTNAAVNLDVDEHVRELVKEIGISLEDLAAEEPDPGLGNGGLGRLAACFLDSMATLDLAGFGYGIRYDYGLFSQRIGKFGQQIEEPNLWLRYQSMWEVRRDDRRHMVRLGGRCVSRRDESGKARFEWIGAQEVEALAYDTPIPGNNGRTVNHLRLWAARFRDEIDLHKFNEGLYNEASAEKDAAENISRVLYPDDSTERGKELRVKQEYFFVSASLQDILQDHREAGFTLDQLPDKVTIQLNDTHPALAVPELMRLLVDDNDVDWDAAWDIVRGTFNYTNHTLLPEALETWPVAMLDKVVPRHLDIIYRLNRQFLDEVNARYPGDGERRRRMSLIDDHGHDGPVVRMAWLATIGSGKVNGVAQLHSDLVRETIFKDFDEFFPGKFVNVTNGVTPRRWVREANPGLADLISEKISGDWENDLERLEGLVDQLEDDDFRRRFREVKYANKERLAEHIEEVTGVKVRPDSMFDVQIKRIHEYKRQHMNLLHVITRYNRIRREPDRDWVPRTVIFAGKAAPAYVMAKHIIQLINNVADVINADPVVGDRLKLVFLPDYSVSEAELIIPAADLSEQISTAGMEASGTGNMKFAMNGALTIGTLDGANVEIREAVGPENIFIFGMTADEVSAARRDGYYPIEISRQNAELSEALDQIGDGYFSPENLRRFQPVRDRLVSDGEWFLVLADYAAYMTAQDEVDQEFRDVDAWTRKAIINTANMGRFSSDRSIAEYAERIWQAGPIGNGAR